MKAFTKYKYGGPEVLKLEDVAIPKISENDLLIEIKASSVNPADWHILRGKPFLARIAFGFFKPKNKFLGADFAGVVKEIGQNVNEFKVGDFVFGETLNACTFSEFACVSKEVCTIIPENTSFNEIACLPLAGITAYQAIVTHGKIKRGENILINGASGGVGHFAVQIAKNYGANVTAICSSKNAEFVRSIGADEVLEYDKINIQTYNFKFDMVVDIHGNLNFKDFHRMGKRGVMVGFTSMLHMIKVIVRKMFSKFSLIQFTAEPNKSDLTILAKLVKEKKIKVCIDKTFPFEKLPEAITYIEKMRTKGKVSVVLE